MSGMRAVLRSPRIHQLAFLRSQGPSAAHLFFPPFRDSLCLFVVLGPEVLGVRGKTEEECGYSTMAELQVPGASHVIFDLNIDDQSSEGPLDESVK